MKRYKLSIIGLRKYSLFNMLYIRIKELMTCNFTSFSTVFQIYQDGGMVIMKSCVQWSPVYDWKDFFRFPLSGIELGNVRSVGQRLTHLA